MKLAHIALENPIDFKDDKIVFWNIEDAQIYYEFVIELKNQIDGEDGNFVLSNNLKSLKLDSDAEMIVGPFDMAFDSKKIANLISKRIIKTAAEDEYFIKFQNLEKSIMEFLKNLIIDADLPVEVEPIEIENLIKASYFKTSKSNSFYDNLINYVSLLLNLSKPKLLILVDIKRYIKQDFFAEFLSFLQYEDVNVLFIDCSLNKFSNNSTRTYFLDNDHCEFEYPIGYDFDCDQSIDI